ncbi:peptidase inhibitor family I36 protein [Streptomyces sp. NPDC021098]|uniref:peptidase inhibitor family I36 protein n=1 Tax=unclassified Streptomyces TaxID=2593676 RepID=UPI00379AD40C
MNRKVAAIAGGIVLTGGLLAGSAGAASASESTPSAASDCPSTYFCVWSGTNYTGHRQQVAGNNADLTQYSVFQNFKSYYNHGASCGFAWYLGKNYTEYGGTIPKGEKNPGNGTSAYIKSNKWC